MSGNLYSTIRRTYSTKKDNKKINKNNVTPDLYEFNEINENSTVNLNAGNRLEEIATNFIFSKLQHKKNISSFILSRKKLYLVKNKNDSLLKEYQKSYVQLFSDQLSFEILNLKKENLEKIIFSYKNINENDLQKIFTKLDKSYSNKKKLELDEIISIIGINETEIKDKIKELLDISFDVDHVNGKLDQNQLSLLRTNYFFKISFYVQEFQLDCTIVNIEKPGIKPEEHEEHFSVDGMSLKLPNNSILVSEFTVAHDNSLKKIHQLIKNGVIVRVLLYHSEFWKKITFK